jgi:hypothetical protein
LNELVTVALPAGDGLGGLPELADVADTDALAVGGGTGPVGGGGGGGGGGGAACLSDLVSVDVLTTTGELTSGGGAP